MKHKTSENRSDIPLGIFRRSGFSCSRVDLGMNSHYSLPGKHPQARLGGAIPPHHPGRRFDAPPEKTPSVLLLLFLFGLLHSLQALLAGSIVRPGFMCSTYEAAWLWTGSPGSSLDGEHPRLRNQRLSPHHTPQGVLASTAANGVLDIREGHNVSLCVSCSLSEQ